MTTTTRTRPMRISWWPLVTIVMAIQLWSARLAFVDVRALPRKAMVIRQALASPSWAALEDVQAPQHDLAEPPPMPKAPSEALVAGKESLSPRLWALPPPQPVEKLELPKAKIPEQKYPALTGMVISQSEERIPEAHPPQPVAFQRVGAAGVPDQESQPEVYVTPGGAAVRVDEIASLAAETLSEDAAETNFEARAQELVQQEIQRRELEKNQPRRRILPTAGGGAIVVASAAPTEPPPSAPSTPTSPIAPASVQRPAAGADEPGVSLIEKSLTPPPVAANYVLSGSFRIADGLAYLAGAMRFELVHLQFGVPVARGTLWEEQARFEIVIPELKGRLVLQLVDNEQNILGASEIILQNLPKPAPNQQIMGGLEMKLRPTPLGATAEVLSAYSMGSPSPIPVPHAEVEIGGVNRRLEANLDGEVDDPDLLPGSDFLFRAQRKTFWGSLAFGLSGQKSTINLFPDKMIDSLIGLVAHSQGEQRELRQKGIIWGRVVQGGEPIEGAVVELAGEYGLSPIYFNEMYLPDPNMEGTGRNGIFAFVGVAEGIQSVRAQVNGLFYPARVMPIEQHHVSHVELEVGETTTTAIRVTMAPQRQQSRQAVFRILGTEREYHINGEGLVHWPRGNGLMLLEADGGEDMDLVRISLDRASEEVTVPMIPSDWLQQLAAEKRINLEGHKGVIVGFVKGKNFEVVLDDRESYNLQNIAYFDQNGHLTRGRFGVAGGGFILFNAPPGFRSVNIIPLGSDKVLGRTVISEAAITNVIPEVSL